VEAQRKERLAKPRPSTANLAVLDSRQRLLWWGGGLLVLVLAVLTRLYGLTDAAIWGDEGSSLLMSRYTLDGIWAHAARDVHPPMYFMMLHG
jgi:hypothetical protein